TPPVTPRRRLRCDTSVPVAGPSGAPQAVQHGPPISWVAPSPASSADQAQKPLVKVVLGHHPTLKKQDGQAGDRLVEAVGLLIEPLRGHSVAVLLEALRPVEGVEDAVRVVVALVLGRLVAEHVFAVWHRLVLSFLVFRDRPREGPARAVSFLRET